MKVDAKALFEVVRQVVQDEIRKSLPGMVRQHLSESYMKKLVHESQVPVRKSVTRPQATTMTELMATDTDNELEEIPEPLHNIDKGIYAQGMPGIKQEESASKLLSKSNPLSFLYEGVKIPGDETETPSIPINNSGLDFAAMNKLVDNMNHRASASSNASTNEMKIKELEAKRKALEVKVG